MTAAVHHRLKARRVQFDLDGTPLHWLPGDPFATHMINGLHLLLPPGELWFCRVYNKALPYVTDPQLRADVEARQRALVIACVDHGHRRDDLRAVTARDVRAQEPSQREAARLRRASQRQPVH